MARHIAAIERRVVDHGFAYDSDGLLTAKLQMMAANCSMVLDIGQSSRDKCGLIPRPSSDLQDSGYYAWAGKQGYCLGIFAGQRTESGLRSLLKLLNCAEARANLYSSTVVNAR